MKKIGEPLLKKLNKQYEASAMVYLKFKRYDLALKTDEEGNPVLYLLVKQVKKDP